MMINDCREHGKPTVAFVDGMCCSSGVNLACRCDRVVVMNPKDEFGCIGTMAAFWAVAHDTVSDDGYRYVELVGKDCPEKNDWYREAAKGEYEKLQAELDKDTEDFHSEVRTNRPLVTDDMLTGKVFEAQEVIPALVDEIGDMNRAIECVFELANQTLTAARLVTAEPKNEPEEKPAGEEPEELAKLSEQQKAAMAAEASKGGLVMAEDGHVTKEVEGLFGPHTEEVAKPQSKEDMTEQEKKAQEAEAAAAAAQEPAQEPATEPAAEPAQEPAQEPAAGEGAQEPAAEPAQEPAAEPSGEGAQEPAAEPAAEPAQEPATEPTGEGAQEPAAEPAAEPAQEPASQEAIENATEELNKIQETLHNAEQMIADKDKEIADLKESLDGQKNTAEQLQADIDQARKDIEAANGTIAERDATIAGLQEDVNKLTKQVSDLKAEIKEMAGNPAPMANADSGIPADNGTGDAPEATGTVRSTVNANMSPKEIRDALRKRDEEAKARNKRR
jgi:ClpP class serine protease/archaellum component FlaC